MDFSEMGELESPNASVRNQGGRGCLLDSNNHAFGEINPTVEKGTHIVLRDDSLLQ